MPSVEESSRESVSRGPLGRDALDTTEGYSSKEGEEATDLALYSLVGQAGCRHNSCQVEYSTVAFL